MLAPSMPERWTDSLQLVGFLLMVGGVGAYSVRAACIFAGALLFVAAGLAQRARARQSSPAPAPDGEAAS